LSLLSAKQRGLEGIHVHNVGRSRSGLTVGLEDLSDTLRMQTTSLSDSRLGNLHTDNLADRLALIDVLIEIDDSLVAGAEPIRKSGQGGSEIVNGFMSLSRTSGLNYGRLRRSRSLGSRSLALEDDSLDSGDVPLVSLGLAGLAILHVISKAGLEYTQNLIAVLRRFLSIRKEILGEKTGDRSGNGSDSVSHVILQMTVSMIAYPH
jgi:hypothetical protein